MIEPEIFIEAYEVPNAIQKRTQDILIEGDRIREAPAVLTVEVEAFCSWSMCTMRMTSNALASNGSTSYLSEGT